MHCTITVNLRSSVYSYEWIISEKIQIIIRSSAFYPHVSDAALHQLVQAYLHEEIDIDISELYPFLPSADIKELLMIALKQTEEKDDETGSPL